MTTQRHPPNRRQLVETEQECLEHGLHGEGAPSTVGFHDGIDPER